MGSQSRLHARCVMMFQVAVVMPFNGEGYVEGARCFQTLMVLCIGANWHRDPPAIYAFGRVEAER